MVKTNLQHNSKEIQAKIDSIVNFYSSRENKELIDSRNNLSAQFSEYINEKINIKKEILTQSFTI